MDAEKLYERSWVMTLLEKARERLREECRSADKAALYEHWQRSESGDADAPTYAEAAAALSLSANGLRVRVKKLRRRYAELVRDEVAQTVDSPAEVDEEIRHLLRVVSG